MSEAQEQAAVIEWCDWQRIPIFHIPNGGKRNPREAAGLKRQGVRKGVPDLCVPIARGPWHSLYIEMKYGRNRPSEEQLHWMQTLSDNGMKCLVCYSAREAQDAISDYLKGGA